MEGTSQMTRIFQKIAENLIEMIVTELIQAKANNNPIHATHKVRDEIDQKVRVNCELIIYSAGNPSFL